MKTKHLISLVLVLLGTNLLTYAATRYATTYCVLTRAQESMDAALKQEGLYEQVYRSRGAPLAIRQAGGRYYWWNEAALCGTAGILLIVTGVLLPFVRSNKSLEPTATAPSVSTKP